MAKKIEGYCQSHDTQEYLDRGNTVFVSRTQRILKDPYCTVVIHKGKPERVFTESEVKAMVREMIMECGTFVSPAGDVNATDIADIKHIAQRHLGITLDPA
jgi:hypothetical protein